MPLLLASESPRRKHLLAQLTDDLQIEAAQVEELTAAADMSPVQVAMYNAALKADAAAVKHKQCWVLGADTIVVMDGRVYGKPADLAEAREFLQKFSGRTHEVVTAVALRRAEDNASYDFTAVSHVRFRQLSDEVINEYLSLVPVLDKAGAYGIQEYGDMLVESLDGELENVIGLPVEKLKQAFDLLGIAYKH